MVFTRAGGGTPISNGYGCKAHTSKGWGIRWEHSLKKWGSLGEKSNFGLKLGGIGWECYFWSFSEGFKSRNLQKKKKNCRKWQKWPICRWFECKEGIFGWERLKSPHFTKNVGSLGDSRDNQQNMGSLVTAALKIGGLWSLTSASPPQWECPSGGFI